MSNRHAIMFGHPPAILPNSTVSPCIRVCVLDDAQICIGCGRSVDEITAWTSLSEVDRLAVLERSALRRAQSNHPHSNRPENSTRGI